MGDFVATPVKKDARTTKKEDDLTAMEDVLETILGNRALSREWMAAMQDYGKGWSEANFDKKLAELKRAKRVTGGGAQGLYYSVSFTAEAQAVRRGDASTTQPLPVLVAPRVKTTLGKLPQPSPYKGGVRVVRVVLDALKSPQTALMRVVRVVRVKGAKMKIGCSTPEPTRRGRPKSF